MRSLSIVAALMVLVFSATARASTFVISYENRPAADPAENFEADCLGATEAADCANRAAALASELVELLSSIEGYHDADSIALFQAAAGLADPKLAELGVRYFSHYGDTPPTLWDSVREFFFGTDPGLGAASAELLTQSADATDVALGEHYLEGRPSYGGWIPAAGADDEWAAAEARDALIEALLAFEESEQFAPASRLLMNDRLLPHSLAVGGEIPVTGFVTDSSVADVTTFFTGVFGRAPYASVNATEARLLELNQEIEELTIRLQMGDQTAGARLTEIVEELTPLQAALSFGDVYGFEDQQCTDHVFWVDGDPEETFSVVPRAVAVGTDRLIGRTAIRYIGGVREGAPPPVDDEPDAGPQQDEPDGGDGNGSPGKKGGGCSTHTEPPGASWAWLVMIGVLTARLRRRRT